MGENDTTWVSILKNENGGGGGYLIKYSINHFSPKGGKPQSFCSPPSQNMNRPDTKSGLDVALIGELEALRMHATDINYMSSVSIFVIIFIQLVNIISH